MLLMEFPSSLSLFLSIAFSPVDFIIFSFSLFFLYIYLSLNLLLCPSLSPSLPLSLSLSLSLSLYSFSILSDCDLLPTLSRPHLILLYHYLYHVSLSIVKMSILSLRIPCLCRESLQKRKELFSTMTISSSLKSIPRLNSMIL